MTLSRWRRVATGVAAGVIVLCAALLGASFRSDNEVSVASDLRPPVDATPIQIEDTPETESTDPESVRVIEDPEPAPDTVDDTDPADAAPATDADEVAGATDGATPGGEEPADTTTAEAPTEAEGDQPDVGDDETPSEVDEPPAEVEAPPAPAPTAIPPAPAASGDSALGIGGGVNDAECALDRVVIYAGARVGGVAGSIRNALAQAGFGAGCPTPVTVLASNCPQQFSGVLGAGSGYDPNRSYVAASASVDRETMTAVMGSVGYTGNSIDILDFGFVNPDRPGEQWLAIFVPPSFSGWEGLAARAGVPATAQSLCAPSGELAG